MKTLMILAVAMLAVTVQGQTNINTLTNYVVDTVSIGYGECNERMTNSLCTNWCDRIPAGEQEQAVKDLAKGGVICKVLGHTWRDGRPGEGNGIWFADSHPGITFRTCKICGMCESKTEGDWK